MYVCRLSLIISIISLVIVLEFFYRRRKDDNSQSSGSIEPKFKASSIEAEFYFVSREEMESRIEYDMQLTCSSMREYPRDLLWNGAEYKGTTIAPDYAEDYTVEEQISPQSPHDYLIKFKIEKKRGDSVKFKTITKVGDTTHIMKNYYSYTVLYQVEELILRVSAPKDLIKDVKKVVYADRSREIYVPNLLKGILSRKGV